MAEKVFIDIQGLSIGYGKGKSQTVVASSIDCQLQKGALYGLIGINGAGKSTLIKTLSGALEPIAGELLFDGRNVNSLSSLQRAKMLSVVLTKSPVSLNLSCFELVALGRHPHTNWIGMLTFTDKEKIAQAMEITDLNDLADQKCFELSDGQLQRALLARAIAQDTPVIILDEPTTHLDLHHKFKMLQLLHKLSKQGKTILYATHDLELALDLCDRLLIVKDKQIKDHSPKQAIEDGVIQQLFPEETVKFDPKTGRFTLNK